MTGGDRALIAAVFAAWVAAGVAFEELFRRHDLRRARRRHPSSS